MPDPAPHAVTFFFSDIQGSTRLVESLGSQYPEVLSRHRALVRDAFAAGRGLEVGTEGDSFFAVFDEAADAVDAAIAAQLALVGEPWPSGAPVRIRIGLHTGQALRDGDDYIGLDVHRAARIMAAAHGGQIVVSEATRLALGQPAGGIELRELGQHRLRDLSMPERLYQVSAEGLASAFPPLRTIESIPNNLPAQATDLVDRETELELIATLLDTPGARLITLVGPGGIGKTRLAVQAAADRIHAFESGAFFADLAPARDVDSMLDALVRAIGTSVPADVEPLDAITDFLKSRAALLVLDNFEQIMDAALQVGQILASCPRVKVLVTSRESLRLRGERLVTVAPLAMPDPRPGLTAAEALESDAVRLFVARADEARPGFVLTDAEAPAVGEICAQLDGLPLAIELAAASLRLLSPEDLRDRLRNQLEPVASGPRDLPDRQRTLRSTIEWSHELLDPDERQLFAALSVFSSASVEAVQQVISRVQPLSEVDPLRTLTALVDKSLLRSDPVAGVQRIEMLATIRRFAAEKLAEAPEVAAAIAEAHAAYFAGVAAETRSPRPGQPHGAAVDRLAAELDNLEVAWRYYLARANIGQLNKLATGLWLIYEGRGWYHRVLALANDLLEVLGTVAPSPANADDEITLRLALARTLLAIRGYTPEVERLYQEALAVSQAAQAAPRRLAVLRSLGSFYLYRAEVDRTAEIGHKLLELAAETDDRRLELEGHMMVGPATAFMGDAATGLGHLQRAMDLFDPEEHRSTPFRLGPNPGVAAPLVSALFRWWLGQPDTASQQVARALEQADRLEHPYTVAWSHFHAGVLDVWNRDYASAQRRATRVLQAASEHDYRIWQALGQVMEGVSLAALDDAHRGAERAVSGVAMYEGIQAPPVFWPLVLSLKAEALARAGEMGESMRTLDQALEVEREGNWLSAMFDAQKAEVLVRTGRPAEAVTWLLRSAKEARALGALMLHLRALVRLSEIDGGADRSGLRTELAALLDAFEEGRDNPDVMKARRIAASDS